MAHDITPKSLATYHPLPACRAEEQQCASSASLIPESWKCARMGLASRSCGEELSLFLATTSSSVPDIPEAGSQTKQPIRELSGAHVQPYTVWLRWMI
ncbi:SNF1-activating kinase 1 [Dissostichus eleginoides]|uniref:SNF1-activating kinase 1 n=1 Tax=Dissostichus eleginoides TaxID=100907 RepID=A0AAD9BMS5_DISEL|nr:SNF1-activating kinase 1 [Dissostichus eleginoides]